MAPLVCPASPLAYVGCVVRAISLFAVRLASFTASRLVRFQGVRLFRHPLR